MNDLPKFEIRFHPKAYREYKKLDGSLVKIVDKSLEELEYRADEIGKVLGNSQNVKLAGRRNSHCLPDYQSKGRHSSSGVYPGD